MAAPGAAAQDCPTCVNYSVSVFVVGSPVLGVPRNASGLTATFSVLNTGNLTDIYDFSCTATGGVTCGPISPASVTLATQQSTQVQVTFSTGTATGTLTLRATGQENGATNTDVYTITLPPVISLVVPTASGGRAVVRNRQPVVRATYVPAGSPMDTTQTALRWRGETVTTLARANRGLIEWDVDSLRWLGIGDSAKAIVKVCSQAGVCDSVQAWVVLPNDNKPVIGFTGVPLEALGRQFSAPFGPGLAVSGAEVETGLGTPAYTSMGVARSAGLVYSTRQSYPRALVPVDSPRAAQHCDRRARHMDDPVRAEARDRRHADYSFQRHAHVHLRQAQSGDRTVLAEQRTARVARAHLQRRGGVEDAAAHRGHDAELCAGEVGPRVEPRFERAAGRARVDGAAWGRRRGGQPARLGALRRVGTRDGLGAAQGCPGTSGSAHNLIFKRGVGALAGIGRVAPIRLGKPA